MRKMEQPTVQRSNSSGTLNTRCSAENGHTTDKKRGTLARSACLVFVREPVNTRTGEPARSNGASTTRRRKLLHLMETYRPVTIMLSNVHLFFLTLTHCAGSPSSTTAAALTQFVEKKNKWKVPLYGCFVALTFISPGRMPPIPKHPAAQAQMTSHRTSTIGSYRWPAENILGIPHTT